MIEYWTIYGEFKTCNPAEIPMDKLHRENGPALIITTNNILNCEKYYIDGKQHREDGPSSIAYFQNGYICEEIYRINDIFHRNDDQAAYIKYYNNNKIHIEEFYLNGIPGNSTGLKKRQFDIRGATGHYHKGKEIYNYEDTKDVFPQKNPSHIIYLENSTEYTAMYFKGSTRNILHNMHGPSMFSYKNGIIDECIYSINDVELTKLDWEEYTNEYFKFLKNNAMMIHPNLWTEDQKFMYKLKFGKE